MTTADELARFLADVARPVIRRRWNASSCIASTRVALDVARVAGVRARRQEVSALVANAAAVELIIADVPLSAWPDQAWTVGIHQTFPGEEVRPGGWRGAHLVAVFGRPGEEVLLDLAADQLDRPRRGIRVPGPVVAPWDGTSTTLGDELGSRLVYSAVERPTSLAGSRDWTDESLRRDVVAELVRLARAAGVIER